MALAMVIGLVVGYAWSVRLLYRQGQHDLQPLTAAPRAMTKVAAVRAGVVARNDGQAVATAVRRRA